MSAEANTTSPASASDDPLADAGDDLTPEFRVVVASQKRRGIRLERLYWRLLADIAERRGQKRSRLVASLIEEAAPNSDNAASVLRGFVARTLDDERGVLAARVSEDVVIRLLQQAPIPAFAINRQKKLHQVNPEFIQLLRTIAGNMNQKIPADVVQLTLDTPIEELFALLTDNKATQCNYSIQLGSREKRGRAKVVAVPPSPSSTLVGYIIT